MPRRNVLMFAAAISGVALALALVTVLVVGARDRAQRVGGPAGQAVVQSEGQPQVGGPFQLVDQSGRPVTEAVLKDRWSLVFFGFTYCPDVCPGTLSMIEATKRRLGEEGEDLQVVFITVDPERDTPQALGDYLSSDGFPRGVIGLTGTAEQIAAAAKVYGTYYEKVGDGEGYTMNHSTALWLVGPDGMSRLGLNHQLGPERAADLIRRARTRG